MDRIICDLVKAKELLPNQQKNEDINNSINTAIKIIDIHNKKVKIINIIATLNCSNNYKENMLNLLQNIITSMEYGIVTKGEYTINELIDMRYILTKILSYKPTLNGDLGFVQKYYRDICEIIKKEETKER